MRLWLWWLYFYDMAKGRKTFDMGWKQIFRASWSLSKAYYRTLK